MGWNHTSFGGGFQKSNSLDVIYVVVVVCGCGGGGGGGGDSVAFVALFGALQRLLFSGIGVVLLCILTSVLANSEILLHFGLLEWY